MMRASEQGCHTSNMGVLCTPLVSVLSLDECREREREREACVVEVLAYAKALVRDIAAALFLLLTITPAGLDPSVFQNPRTC